MGFYGNITNTARTQFQFDRTYPNRYEMEKNKYNDGIYAGRYVLIEYETNASLDNFLRVYEVEDIGNGRYTCNYANAQQGITKLTQGDIDKGTIVYYAKSSNSPADNIHNITDCKFLICETDYIEGSAIPAEFREVVDGDNSSYYINYNIDVSKYSEEYGSRGYDSTVWQKVYSEDKEKYVMIAELNTVVPTFDVTPDAPTMNPIVPHFDINSTDVYYKLHWQAPWGFRVAAAEEGQSDEKTTWTTYIYDETTNTHEIKNDEKNAAIYYNKAAFDPQVDSSRTSTENINKKVEIQDGINLSLAASGQKYNLHNGKTGEDGLGEQNDIQELTINLPAVGNMMSDAWDIIHGPLRNDARTDGNSSLQGRLDSFKEIKENQIPVKRTEDGTLVGSKINNAIAYDDAWEGKMAEILEDNTDPTFERDDAWIKTVINTSGLVGGVVNGDEVDQSNNSGISIHHTFHATDNSTSTVDKNTGELKNSDTYKSTYIKSSNIAHNKDDMIELYVPYVDAKGHVVGHNIETITLPYGYKIIQTNGRSDDENSDNSGVIAGTSTVADNTQDILNINSGNYWVRADIVNDEIKLSHTVRPINTEDNNTTNLNKENGANNEENITIPDWEYDKAGHIISKKSHTYTLPFGFKTISTNGRSDEVLENATGKPDVENIVADTTQDILIINSGNKWIRIDTDVNNDTLTIRHDVHKTEESNSNSDWTKEEENTTIPVITYKYDEAGHYLSHHTETYQLPFGYGKIKGDEGDTAATATYDELTFGSDDWLTATVSTDKVVFSHDFTPANDSITISDKNTENGDGDNKGKGDTLKLYTPKVDDKGHVVGKNIETVTLPYGYKTFTGDSGSSSADNTQDSMAVNGDDWIKTTVSNDNIIITHTTPVTDTSTSASTFTPSFGGEFKFNVYDFDTRGHKFNTTEHTVKIPELSLTNGAGNVVTGLSLPSASTGAFVETKANLGTLTITGYEKPTTLSKEQLEGTDSLNTALGKIEYRLDDLNNSDNAVVGQYVSAVEQEKGKITVSRADLPIYTLETGSTNGTVKFNGENVSVYGLGSAAYKDEEAFATSNILDTTFEYKSDSAETAEQKTIAELFTIVANLVDKVATLTTELNTLKQKVETEHPSTEEEPIV